jgi:hypothetical protein
MKEVIDNLENVYDFTVPVLFFGRISQVKASKWSEGRVAIVGDALSF